MMTTRLCLLLGTGLLLVAEGLPSVASPGIAAVRTGTTAAGAVFYGEPVQKLKLRFDEADVDKSGSLTLEEARRAGFGFVAAHFNLIDTMKRGTISFEELISFMARMRKETGAKQG